MSAARSARPSAPLYSYFALVADDPSVQIVNHAQTWYLKQMLKGTEWEDLPLLSAAAPFKAGGRGGPDYYTDVPVGPSRSRTSPTSTSIPTPCRPWRSPARRSRNGSRRSAGIFNQIEPAARPTSR